MAYNFNIFNQKTKAIEERFAKDLSSLRTGRATPAVLDGVIVESYGARVPLKEVGSVTIEDARTILIAPWDPTHLKEIEKAVVAGNLGLSVSVGDAGVRVTFPELTSERREAVIKLAKEKYETARVALRQLRDEIVKDVQALEKTGGTGKDEVFRLKSELQKLVDEVNKKFDAQLERKEKEIAG